jgi:uncharacterized protein (DUF58 family)
VTAPSGLVGRVRARRPLWSVYPTERAAAVLLGLAVLWLVPVAGAAIGTAAIAAFAAAILFDYVRLPRRGDVVVRREAPPTLGLGDTVDIRYTVSSTWPWPIQYELFDRWPSGVAGEILPAWRTLAPSVEETVAALARGDRRGSHELGAVGLRIRTPFGLLTRIVRTPSLERAAITVVPSLTNVRRFRLLAMQHRLSDAGIRALKQRGEGTAFAGLRDYVPGDDPRLLDWKATARHRRLITREQTIERSQTVISMIDCGRAMTQLAGRYPRFEHVLSAALVLSDVAASSGDRVGMIAFDDQVRSFVAPQRGVGALRTLHNALSALDATLTEPDYATAFRMLATSQRRRALIVFFSDVVDVRTAGGFVAYAARTARRHALVFVAIQNEALLAAAMPTSAGSAALFRSAAAEELVREREQALARMRGAGIAVLDVAPTRITAAVVNRYLEIKARGEL